MEKIRSTQHRHLHGCLGDIAYELRIRYQTAAREPSWTPAINAYLVRGQIVICVDLAGVAREQIELEVEPRRLVLRGVRQSVDAIGEGGPPLQVLALEIDQGFFYREISLPRSVDPGAVTAEQCNGLLWIRLPLVP
jgi:HSP20 family protein